MKKTHVIEGIEKLISPHKKIVNKTHIPCGVLLENTSSRKGVPTLSSLNRLLVERRKSGSSRIHKLN